MLERPDANSHLMEDLYDSSIPELLHVNVQAQKELGRMLVEKDTNAMEYMDLQLIPDYMKDKDGLLMVNVRDQRKLAEEVLNGLHEAWRGTEALEFRISDTRTENYWEFVDYDNNFTSWTVVESHNSKPVQYEVGVSAYIVAGTRRPTTYQTLLDEKEARQEKLAEEPNWLKADHKAAKDTTDKRLHKVAKSVSRWVNKQTNLPPRPNRFE